MVFRLKANSPTAWSSLSTVSLVIINLMLSYEHPRSAILVLALLSQRNLLSHPHQACEKSRGSQEKVHLKWKTILMMLESLLS